MAKKNGEKASERKDIVVTMNHPPVGYDLEFIEAIQNGIDKVLVGFGFARSEVTEIGEKTEWSYYQFGVCQAKSERLEALLQRIDCFVWTGDPEEVEAARQDLEQALKDQ